MRGAVSAARDLDATLYTWCSKYGGLGCRRCAGCQLEEEKIAIAGCGNACGSWQKNAGVGAVRRSTYLILRPEAAAKNESSLLYREEGLSLREVEQ